MTNVRELTLPKSATVAEGLRAIADALDAGDIKEPPYALVVFGVTEEDMQLNVLPVGRRLPGNIETVGMLTVAAGAVGFGEAVEVAPLPIN